MAFDELPADPYKLLGVAKDATLPDIRSAHRKLVLKCHPDKVQDTALKAIKQDEFQKVQQAYELLSDDNRRLQYDEQVKLYALRKEMAGARGHPTARSNPFEYEVKNAEPRPNTYKYTPRPPPMPRETTKVYPQQQRPSSYEDVVYEEPVRHPKKSPSYESADRDRKSRTKEEDRTRNARRHEEEEREKQKWEKESKRVAHGEKKKRDDKAKKRASEERYNTRAAYVEEESSDDYRATRSKDKVRQERRMEEEIRIRSEEARAEATREAARKTEALRLAPLTPKHDANMEYAAEYMQAARRKVAPATDDFHQKPMQRAETFAAPEIKYNISYASPTQRAAPQFPSDEELPRRSSAPRMTRRSSETPPTRSKDAQKPSSKDKEREKGERKRPGRSPSRDPYIVEPPSPPLAPLPKQKPSLQTHNSAPPTIPTFSRKEPSRSKTEYPRQEPPPPTLPRAATFQFGDRAPDRNTQRGSRLKKTVDYSSGSESDSPVYTSNRHSYSPPPQPRRREAPEPTRYIIDNGRSVPITTRGPHRSEMRGIDDEIPYAPRDRERSESPHGTTRHLRVSDRPPIPRAPGSGGSRQAPARSASQAYYPTPPEAPEPVILTARPKMLPRESSHGHTHTRSLPRGSGGAPPPAGYFGEVKYTPPYRPEDVIYNDVYRRGSDPTHHPHAGRDYGYPVPPPRNERVHA